MIKYRQQIHNKVPKVRRKIRSPCRHKIKKGNGNQKMYAKEKLKWKMELYVHPANI